MNFDLRVYIGQSFDGARQTVDELCARMDELGVDMALACPFRPASYDLKEANLHLAEAIRSRQDRLVGAARIDPWQPDAPALLRRMLEEFGFRALYLNPWEEHFRADMAGLDPILSVAEEYKIPVLVSSGFPWVSEAFQVCRLAERWPGMAFVMTNGGQINISGLGQADVTLALRKSPNLFIETAGVYRQDFLEETMETFGSERVLFGSGAPYFDQRYEILRVRKANGDQDCLDAIQGGNAVRLLRLN